MATYRLIQAHKSFTLPFFLKYTMGEPTEVIQTVKDDRGNTRTFKETVAGNGTVDVIIDPAAPLVAGDLVSGLGPHNGTYMVVDASAIRPARGNYSGYSVQPHWQQIQVKYYEA